jgi:ketosteroid isomerase-like protein
MSRASVDIVRRGTALLNEGRWDALFEMYHPDVEFCDLRSAVDTPQILRGVKTLRDLLTSWGDAWTEFGSEVYEYIDADPYVVCDTRWYGIGRESNVPIDVRQADVCEVRDGRVIRVTLGYASKEKALEALGLQAWRGVPISAPCHLTQPPYVGISNISTRYPSGCRR